MKKRIAVIIFNLGGPDSLKSVKPFLFNLFNDKYIIGLPQPFRYILEVKKYFCENGWKINYFTRNC
jgi:protoheme ferro-lyase